MQVLALQQISVIGVLDHKTLILSAAQIVPFLVVTQAMILFALQIEFIAVK